MAGFVGAALVCSANVPAAGVAAPGVACPVGLNAFWLPAYLVDPGAVAQFDFLSVPFSLSEGAAYFSLGFGLTVVFWLLGQSLGVVVRPFWSRL